MSDLIKQYREIVKNANLFRSKSVSLISGEPVYKNGGALHHNIVDLRTIVEQHDRIAELEAEIGLLMQENEDWRDCLPRRDIEQQIKGIYAATNHVADNNDLFYMTADLALELCEQLAEQLRKGGEHE